VTPDEERGNRREGTHVLNLGVLAHVDAGKTSLTERLLFESGAIESIGSVDEGTTRTDSGAVERERGITVRAAVASFEDGGRQYNLIDTPGHIDFVAEVERGLMAVDAVILVVAAPEGVQPQTRALYRVINRLRLPAIVFVNKIDCLGAAGPDILDELQRTLGMLTVPMGVPVNPGTDEAAFQPFDATAEATLREWAERLAENDDEILESLVSDGPLLFPDVLGALRSQTRSGLVRPVVFGSSATGAGIDGLRSALRELLEPPVGEPGLSADVFSIERTEHGEKVALVRCFGGTLTERQQVEVRHTNGVAFRSRIRGLDVVTPGREGPGRLTAGHIARVRGLAEVRIGDRIGDTDARTRSRQFPPPSLEVAVRPTDPMRAPALRAALLALADQDPLIRAERGPDGQSTVHLYGEVQQEVLQQTLATDFGVEAAFEPPDVICLERPVGVGSAIEVIGNGFLATVGLRVEPGHGFAYRREVELGALPTAFHDAVEEAAAFALSQGCYGWRVTDIEVVMTRCGYWARPYSAARDFRDVTPHVLMQALARAGTRVYEPVHRYWVEFPQKSFGAVINHLNRHEGEVESCREEGDLWLIEGRLPLRFLAEARKGILSLAGGSVLWTSLADGDKLVTGHPPPRRPRFDGNPFSREEYMRFLASR
jgi:ribosomal protection tetracycline resistance protein